MIALASVWTGLFALLVAGTMFAYRPAMTDLTVTLVLYFTSPGGLCFAGMVLWAHRKAGSDDAGVVQQRLQAKAAIGMSVIAAGIVYVLIIRAEKIEPTLGRGYNPNGNIALVHQTMDTPWKSR